MTVGATMAPPKINEMETDMTKQANTKTKSTTFACTAALKTKMRRAYAAEKKAADRMNTLLREFAKECAAAGIIRREAGKALAATLGEKNMAAVEKAVQNRWQYIAAEEGLPIKAGATTKTASKRRAARVAKQARAIQAKDSSVAAKTTGPQGAKTEQVAAWLKRNRLADVAALIRATLEPQDIGILIDLIDAS